MKKEENNIQTEEELIEDMLKKEKIQPLIKLNYSLKTAEERKKLVDKIIESTPLEKLTSNYLEILSDYIVFAMTKEEKKEKKILTNNRLVTIKKRETSFEGLSDKMENGEDGIYNITSDLGKNILLTHKDPITQKDIDNSLELQNLKKAIEEVEKEYLAATGKRKYLLKKQIIEMRQDQYVIRNGNRGGTYTRNGSASSAIAKVSFDDKIYFDDNNNPVNDGLISFFNPKHIQALLCNYSDLKQAAYGNFDNDLWYLMEDLDNLIEKTLKENYPLYYDLLIYKIDGKTNLEIQYLLERDHNVIHSIEYLSSLWRKKIPKLLAEQAEEDYLLWYYTTQEYGQWKRCTRCGEVKLAHNKFFSKNKSSKDGWYSLCKACRNSKSKKNQKLIEARNRKASK